MRQDMKQEVTNFGKFYRLLRLMPGWQDDDELKEKLVWQFTGYRTNSLREMKRTEYDRMVEYMEGMSRSGQAPEGRGDDRNGNDGRTRPGYYGEEAAMWRKRAIAAVFGFYRKIREEVTLEYVKGIICRAGGTTDINRIPTAKMREIYNAWLMKQRVKGNVDREVKRELVKFGYLEKGDGL